jgi:restriction system protein
MVHEKVPKAFFMTSGKYSDEAKAFAASNRITLIDGALLLAMLKRLSDEARQKLFKFATAGDYNIPSCPTCGRKMRLITGKEGQRDFWGCPGFPKCRQKLWARRGASDLPMAVYQ